MVLLPINTFDPIGFGENIMGEDQPRPYDRNEEINTRAFFLLLPFTFHLSTFSDQL
jgi:hypothetical protein